MSRLRSLMEAISHYTCIQLQWYDMKHDTSLHTTDRQRRVVRNEWTMCFVDVHIMRMCTCKLITNWICTCFCAAMLKDTWPEARKAFQSKDGTLLPLFGSLCLINSSERAWTWVRNQKDSFFNEESQYHNVAISCSIFLFILWQNYYSDSPIHPCIVAALYMHMS